jgi:hypothetical protein
MIREETSVFDLLKELISQTKAIAEYSSDRDIDLMTLARNCNSLLQGLQSIAREHADLLLAGGKFSDPGDRKVLEELLADLSRQTQASRGTLEELLAQTDSELGSLRLMQRQTQGYYLQA